jgi:quercetin dioxygenase-like cupin family protein
MTTQQQGQVNPYYQMEPYQEFLKTEGVPVVEAYSVDCHTIPLEPWSRLGGRGAYVHLAGRSDYLSCYVVEIPPGGHLNPERHMHDELIHVISGRGATTVELPSGAKHTFEWGPASAFAIPLNAKHQLFNGSGSEPARLAAVTNLPIILNIFHTTDYLYGSTHVFNERFGEERYFRGEGTFRAVRPARHQWETNFVPDLVHFELPPAPGRGAGANIIQFCFADSSMHGHMSEFPPGTYKKAHAHNAGAHIFCVTGQGYSLLWREGQDPTNTVRVDWKPGSLYAPPDGPTYHQHFNVSPGNSRYLVFGFGGMRYRVLESKNRSYDGMDVSQKEGGNQVEYEDEDPRVAQLYERELAKRGLKSRMREYLGARAKAPMGLSAAR